MLDSTPHTEMTIEMLLNRWLETAVIFRHYKMICIGCQVSAFCTIKDAAEIHDLPVDQLLAELNQAIDENASSEF